MYKWHDSLLPCPNLFTRHYNTPTHTPFFSLPGTKGTTLTLKQVKAGLTLTPLPTILPYIEIFGPMELGGKATVR